MHEVSENTWKLHLNVPGFFCNSCISDFPGFPGLYGLPGFIGFPRFPGFLSFLDFLDFLDLLDFQNFLDFLFFLDFLDAEGFVKLVDFDFAKKLQVNNVLYACINILSISIDNLKWISVYVYLYFATFCNWKNAWSIWKGS